MAVHTWTAVLLERVLLDLQIVGSIVFLALPSCDTLCSELWQSHPQQNAQLFINQLILDVIGDQRCIT